MAKVKVKANFHDKEDGEKLRSVGEVFECAGERAERLESLGLVSVLEQDTKPAPKKAATRKRAAKPKE